MKKGKVLLITPNLKGIGDGVNRIQPSLGLMLMAQMLKDDGHEIKIHDTDLILGCYSRIITEKR